MELTTKHASEDPINSSIYTFYATVPTITHPRLEALGTGSQPPFLAFTASFSKPFIEDDNILYQLKNTGYRSQVIGKSPWTAIYSSEHYEHIDADVPYKAKALDQYVNEKVKTKLKEDNWDFLLTHADELDHISHTRTINSVAGMKEIEEDDKLIDRNIKLMGDETLLVAFGDHGTQINEGTHGGPSKEETEAAFFCHAKKGFTFKYFQYPEKLPQKTRDLIEKLKQKRSEMFKFLTRDAFYQVDIVPTTASMFNMPIPFRNLGMIAPELLHYNVSNEKFISQSLFELLMDHLINFLQAYHYNEVGYNDYDIMKEQWPRMNEIYKQHKDKLTPILQKLKEAMTIEETYFKSSQEEILDDQWENYSEAIENTVDYIIVLREALTYHREKYTEQWASVDMIYLYASWILRILLTITLAMFIFIASYIIAKRRFELLNNYSLYIFAILIQVVLVLIIAFVSNADFITVPLSFLLCFFTIFAQGKIIYSQLAEVRQFICSSQKFPIIATIVIYVYCTFYTGKITSKSNFSFKH